MQKENEIYAGVLRQLIAHLDSRKDVQNIDLMNMAGFCRNCLSKWMVAEAESQGETLSLDEAREKIYGMPYSDWKANHQTPATAEQQRLFEQSKHK